MSNAPSFKIQPLLELHDARGNLVVAETGPHIPFEVKRIFVISNVEVGSQRGGHAHRELHQFLMMMSGSCTVTVDTGVERTTIVLDKPAVGLHAPPMCWLDLTDFSPDAVCAVLASETYLEADYIRDREEFESLVRQTAEAWDKPTKQDF